MFSRFLTLLVLSFASLSLKAAPICTTLFVEPVAIDSDYTRSIQLGNAMMAQTDFAISMARQSFAYRNALKYPNFMQTYMSMTPQELFQDTAFRRFALSMNNFHRNRNIPVAEANLEATSEEVNDAAERVRSAFHGDRGPIRGDRSDSAFMLARSFQLFVEPLYLITQNFSDVIYVLVNRGVSFRENANLHYRTELTRHQTAFQSWMNYLNSPEGTETLTRLNLVGKSIEAFLRSPIFREIAEAYTSDLLSGGRPSDSAARRLQAQIVSHLFVFLRPHFDESESFFLASIAAANDLERAESLINFIEEERDELSLAPDFPVENLRDAYRSFHELGRVRQAYLIYLNGLNRGIIEESVLRQGHLEALVRDGVDRGLAEEVFAELDQQNIQWRTY
jgi:hypothetical protein